MQKISKKALGSMLKKYYTLKKQQRRLEKEIEALRETFEELSLVHETNVLEGTTKTGKWVAIRSPRTRDTVSVQEVKKVAPQLVRPSYYIVWVVSPEKDT